MEAWHSIEKCHLQISYINFKLKLPYLSKVRILILLYQGMNQLSHSLAFVILELVKIYMNNL